VAFGVYIHVPFCATRCGYCDFNTYAPGDARGSAREPYVEAALGEIRMARKALEDDGRPDGLPIDTVYFGGGTPTVLPNAALIRLLDGVREAWGLAPGAEVTVEANPDSVTPEGFVELAAAGFTRVSLGMQSAVPEVLATLERTHDPENVTRAVAGARAAGLDVSLDLIYGTPGESLDDWRASIDAAVALAPDHLSAYALVIEPGTRMGAALRRGAIDEVDPDLQAEMYEEAERALNAAGYGWYEVSNWARDIFRRCRHNMGYWKNHDWWGIGAGAHSHLRATYSRSEIRWWNVKNPRTYTERIEAGLSPEEEREFITEEQERTEAIMLHIRLKPGLNPARLTPEAAERVPGLVAEGLLEPPAKNGGRLVLTIRGRLLANAVIRALT